MNTQISCKLVLVVIVLSSSYQVNSGSELLLTSDKISDLGTPPEHQFNNVLDWPESPLEDIKSFRKSDLNAPKSVTATINLGTVLTRVSERFVSIALDTSLVEKHWYTFDFSSKKLKTLVEALSPGYLRLGGNAADFLVFRRNAMRNEGQLTWRPHSYDENRRNISTFYMSAKDFDKLNNFALKTGHRLLFDFNVLLRDGNNQWNSSNAQEILNYSIERNYTHNLEFELGNEPNSFTYNYNRTVTAKQLAKDFGILHSLLHDDAKYSKYFARSLLVGPSITQPKPLTLKYLTGFLQVVGDRISAVTWHHYYSNGRTAKLEDFMSYTLMNELSDEITSMYQAVRHVGYNNATYWLGETSSCYGGGAPELSDRYVAGFLWLDKLGVAAQRGIDVVIRQSLYRNYYALLDDSLNPNPDYWLTLLYKTFVGSRVLNVSFIHSSPDLRLYAHCTRVSKRSGYVAGAVTVYALNLGDDDVTLTLNQSLAALEKHVYWLQPNGSQGLKSRCVNLNGKLLKLIDDMTLPNLKPVVIPGGHDLLLRSRSFGFVVIPGSRAAACE